MEHTRKYYAIMYEGELKIIFWHQFYNADTLLLRLDAHKTLSHKRITETEATTLREMCDVPLLHYTDVGVWIDRKRYRNA